MDLHEPSPESLIRSQATVDGLIAAGKLSAWARSAYTELCRKIADDAFPCTFGTVALEKGDILFAFIESSAASARRDELVSTFTEYARFVKGQTRVRASMCPLAIFIPPPDGWDTIEDYFDESWKLLAALHARDPEPWPHRIPSDPDTPGWSFCFAGVPLFLNFKTPLHCDRRSRRTRRSYLLLVQSRDGFDVVAGNTAKGRNARRIIREKLAAYDRVPIYPALGHYGTPENREWKQYFVPETNEPMSKRCPFHPKSNKD